MNRTNNRYSYYIFSNTVLVFMLFISSNLQAAELFRNGPSVFNYNFAQIAYLDGSGGYDGFGITGSGDIKPNIAISAKYVSAEDVDGLRLLGTYYIQSQKYPRADWNFSAGLDRAEDEGGVFLSAGTRYALNEIIELNAAMELSTVGDTDLSIQLAGFYELTPGLSAFVQTALGDDSVFGLGVRFYWR